MYKFELFKLLVFAAKIVGDQNLVVYIILSSTLICTESLEVSSPSILDTAGGSPRILASSPLAVQDGKQFAAALDDSNVDLLWIAAAVVDVTNSGWSSPAAVYLTRNVTIMGEPSFKNYPLLRLNYVQGKIRLAHGVYIAFKNLVLEGVRRDIVSRVPGFDIFAPALPGGYADLIVEDSVVVIPACLPQSYRSSNHAGILRPDGYPPGIQLYSTSNQTGCINDTAAPAQQRCWPDMVHYVDFVLYGADVNDAGSPVSNNMHVVLRNTTIACEELVNVACIVLFSPVGCLLAAMRNVTSAGDGVGVSAAGGAGGSGSHGSANTTLVVALVVGVVGGLLLVVLAVLLVFRRRRCRQRRRSSSSEGDFAQLEESRKEEGVRLTVAAAASPGNISINSAAPKPAPKSAGVPAGNARPQGHAVLSHVSTESLPAGDEIPVPLPSAVAEAPKWCDDSEEMLVTPMTPQRADLQVGVEMQAPSAIFGLHGSWSLNPGSGATATDSSTAAGQQPSPEMVTLLSVTRGKGAFGRVMEGLYGGQKVAVKVVECWRPPHALQARAGQAARAPPLPLIQPDPEQPEHADDHNLKQAAEAKNPHGHAEAGPRFDAAVLSDALMKAFAHEVEVLGRCEHPNVVRLLAACVTPPRLCLVMELMETSLDKLLYGSSLYGNILPLPKVLHIATCVCRALAYLHPTVVHRDLKPGNVLINNHASDTPAVKLGDFGLSRLRVTVAPTTSPEAGTPPYMAPECFDVNNTTITHKADMFSLGVLLWEMLSGARPWAGCNMVVIAFQVSMLRNRLPLTSIRASRCSTRLQQIITSCWDSDPVRRPAAAEVAKELADMLEACNRDTFRSFATESMPCTSVECVQGS